MGSIFSSNSNKPQYKILVTGLDASGKTTMLYKLRAEEINNTVPVIGFHVEQFLSSLKKIDIVSWDSGGRTRMDSLKRHFLTDVAGVIYFVDSNYRERIEESVEELRRELIQVEHDQSATEKVPILIFANKMDMPNAMNKDEISDKFNQPFMKDRAWYVQSSCATSGDGLYEGLDWFTKEIERGSHRVTAACDVDSNKA